MLGDSTNTMSSKELQEIISPKFTEQVLFDIVKKKSGLNNIKINKLEIGSASKKGDSYLSNICRFTINATGTRSDDTEETVSFPVIVKFLLKNLARRKTFRSTDFFENEVIFYEKVWTTFQKFQESKNIQDNFLPLVLSYCIDGTNDYIAMLDVCCNEGYRSADRGSGLDYKHTKAILETLAKFHSLSLAMKDQQPEIFEKAATSLKETYFAEKFRKWYGRFQENVFIVIRDAVSKELPPLYLEKLNKLIDNDLFGVLCKLCDTRTGPLSVVAHGDVWVPNFLIKYNKEEQIDKIVMIDFQLTRYSSLANDLVFFLYSCVDDSLLETQWDTLVSDYHKALVENLEKLGSNKNLVSLEDLHAEIRANNVFGVGMSMEGLCMSMLEGDEVCDLDAIQGDEAVPLESVWILQPYKQKEKRKRIANMIKIAVDKKFM